MALQASATQADNVYRQLREDILTCKLRPGAKIHIADAAKAMGVSLGAVREALARLTAEDIAVSTAQKGYTVPDVSIDDLVDLTNTRIAIECICLEASLTKGDIEWESSLVAAYHRLQNIPEVSNPEKMVLNESWAAAHRLFHKAIVAGCNSPSLLKIREMLFAQTERYRWLSVPLRKTDRDVAKEHSDIFNAVIARDVPLAKKLMGEHFQATTDILVKSMRHTKTQSAGVV